MLALRAKFIGKLAAVTLIAAAVGACATGSKQANSKNAWTSATLATALAAPTRPQADRDRDADRKPAELLTFFGVERGMTAVDVMASGGYLTEVLSIAVGPSGKVHAQNALPMLQYNNGAYAKAIAARLEGNRLPNVARLDGDVTALAPNSVDFAITAMNLHDIYNRSAQGGQAMVKTVFDALKPGGVFGVIDHAGNAGADNAKLHRMTKQQAIDVAKAVGFVVEAESNLLAHPADDHTKGPFDPSLRGKTDQFVLKLRKPGK